MKETMQGTMLKSQWIGLGQNIPGREAMVPVNKNGGNAPPPDPEGGNGGGGGNCPAGCGCHPLWYIGSAVGVMMVLTTLLARS